MGRNSVQNKRATWKPQFSEAGGQLGCPEDHLRDTERARVHTGYRERERAPRIAITPAEPIDPVDVERRVLRAMQTLRAVPDRERRYWSSKSIWPDYVREHMDAYASVEAPMPRFRPTPADISDYLTALSWVRHLSRSDWRLLWWRSFGFSFGLMGKYVGKSDETVRRHYRDAMIDVWTAANNISSESAAA
jgi:hypothetical protein